MATRSILLVSLSVFLLAGPSAAWAQTGTLSGTVSDANQNPVGDAEVKVGELTATSDHTGAYTIANVPEGSATVEVKADWFEDHSQTTSITAGQDNTLDITLQARALQVLDDDKAIAEAYNETFDWSTDKLSITYIAPPTRANIDRGLYFRNPALFRDTSAESPVTAGEWDFPIPDGAPNQGQQAFEEGSITNSICKTPLTKEERARALLWEPAVKLFLAKWDIDKAENLYHVTFAVEGQHWGGSSTFSPQTLQRVYLHEGEIWVEVVFEDWVSFENKVTDSNGDGYNEIFAKVSSAHYTTEVYDQLAGDYLNHEYQTLELREDLNIMLDDLYSRTNPVFTSVIGVPFDVPGHGTLQYPFVVLTHSNDAVNVLLVDPVAPEVKDECGGGGGGCSVVSNPRFPVAVCGLILLPLLAAFLLRRKHL
jgi:hypothetical protein